MVAIQHMNMFNCVPNHVETQLQRHVSLSKTFKIPIWEYIGVLAKTKDQNIAYELQGTKRLQAVGDINV